MKKNLIKFAAVVAVVIFVVINQKDHDGLSMAGGPIGNSLKELNDSTKAKKEDKTNVVAFIQVNSTTEENLFQIMTIGSWERPFNNFYVGADLVGTVSTQFGVMCPTYDVRFGSNLGAWRAECKVGNFTRNSVTTSGFDPQFGNNCILWSESASVNNAVQMSFIGKTTKVYFGHQKGEKFYKFNDGNYYVGVEQRIGNVALSSGADFTEQTTGYAAVKWNAKNNAVTLTANKLGTEDKNFVISYVRNGIFLGKDIRMSVGNALYLQPEKSGLQLVASLNKGKFTLFTETGGYLVSGSLTPVGGVGLNYNL